MGTKDCFFYEQKSFRDKPKRARKLPEELPESLKFAHLNPKVAALLANKERAQKQEELESNARKNVIPDINSAFQNLKNQLDLKLSNDEDSQRFLFQEARASAASILQQLANLLYKYENIISVIPNSLQYQLLATFKELIVDVIYVPREWQTIAAREIDIKSSDHNSDDDIKSVLEEDVKLIRPASELGKHKKKLVKTVLPEIVEDDKKTVKTKTIGANIHRHTESKNSAHGNKTSKNRGTTQRSPGLRRGTIHDGDKISHYSESPQEMRTPVNPHNMSVIHFELSSKLCEDKGWIMNRGSEMEIEKEKLLEWCLHILQLSLKSIKEQNSQAVERPVQLRHYGDTRLESLLKYRKSPIKQDVNPALKGDKPKIPSLPDEMFEDKTIMLSGHTDGTTVVYYPSGRSAIICSAAGFGRPGYYTLVYNDDDTMNLLACFTPYGHGCCYHNNGVVWFLSTSTGGHIADKDGSIQRTWKWPPTNVKLQSPISIQLNKAVGFRCTAFSQMSLFYNNEKESAKFLVSPIPDAVEPAHSDENEQLLTTFSFTSNAAKDIMRLFAPRSKSKLKKKKDKDDDYIDDNRLMEYTEVTIYDTPAEKDLAKLQRRSRNLIDDWMDHYRISVGLRSPSLNYVQDIPPNRKRYSQSAKISHFESESRAATIGLDEKTNIKSLRAPSAPSGQMTRVIGRPISPANVIKPLESVQFDDQVNEGIGGDGDMVFSSTGSAVMNRLLSASPQSRVKSARLKSAGKSGIHQLEGSVLSCDSCPVILRQRMMGINNIFCKCSRYTMPIITDCEFDMFLTKVAPNAQLQVVVIVSSLFPNSNHALDMLEQMYAKLNRNRMRPCSQCRTDTERFIKYDINTAADKSDHTQPLLLTRHNAIPGMILIYSDGNLLFCDHIFNGYGNTKKDFKKQLTKSRLDAIHGIYLPKDYRFSPTRGHHGPRSAWGGEIGGAGVDSYGSPGTTKDDIILKRPSSASTSDEQVPPHLSNQLPVIITDISKKTVPTHFYLYESVASGLSGTCRQKQTATSSYYSQITSASIM